MSTFSAEWLALREGADAEARSRKLLGDLSAHLSTERPLTVLDLGAGTGANLRYSAREIGGAQNWVLVDNDRALLEAARSGIERWAARIGAGLAVHADELTVEGRGFSCRVRGLTIDLSRQLGELPLVEGCLVGGSALLDLVSEHWLTRLLTLAKQVGARLAFPLIYDGRIVLEPPTPDDDWVRSLVNEHQLSDKGFGAAMGPAASARTAELLRREGYAVGEAASDWVVDGRYGPLQSALLDGWVDAAEESAPEHASRLHRWHAMHRTNVEAGDSRFLVGHRDIVAWPER